MFFDAGALRQKESIQTEKFAVSRGSMLTADGSFQSILGSSVLRQPALDPAERLMSGLLCHFS
jgi:hypothetical protein